MGKRFLALVLCLLTVLPLAACGAPISDDATEFAPMPMMDIEDLDKLAASEQTFPGTSEAESREIWAYAHKLVEEWNERYQQLLEIKKNEKKPTALKKDYAAEYTRIIYSSTHEQYAFIGDASKAKKTRTLSMLKGYAESSYATETFEQDEWGGFMDESMKQEATGYFYTKKINGRWWLITPTGYPTFMRAIQGIMPVYSDYKPQQEATTKIYGSNEKWAIATTLLLKNDYGVYTTNAEYPEIFDVPNGFSQGTVSIDMVTGFGLEMGIAWKKGSTYFHIDMASVKKSGDVSVCDGIMPMFSSGFEAFADKEAKRVLYDSGLYNNPRVVVITSDNEVPIKVDLLEKYIRLTNPDYLNKNYAGNKNIKMYYETYATTITWMRFMTGKEDIMVKDITDELKYLFLGFMYDRVLAVSSAAIKKYDQNHIYAGIRSLSGGEGAAGPDASNSVLDREWIVRFTALHTDAYALNWYSRWNPNPTEYENMYLWTQDKPIFMTEFGFKSQDELPDDYSNSGGTFYVHTQEERGAGFESLVMDFMEWPNVVGWNLYRYNHYIHGQTNFSSSSGVVNNNGVLHAGFADSIALINQNCYSIARFMDYRQKNWSKYFK